MVTGNSAIFCTLHLLAPCAVDAQMEATTPNNKCLFRNDILPNKKVPGASAPIKRPYSPF